MCVCVRRRDGERRKAGEMSYRGGLNNEPSLFLAARGLYQHAASVLTPLASEGLKGAAQHWSFWAMDCGPALALSTGEMTYGTTQSLYHSS